MTRTRLARGIVSGAKTGSGTSLVGSDDFGSYSTGSAPPGYTAKLGNATLNVASSANADSGGNVLELDYGSADDGRTVVVKDDIGVQGDAEITFRSFIAGDDYPGAGLRMSGVGTNLNAYRSTALNDNDGNPNNTQLSNYVDDSFSSLNLGSLGFTLVNEPIIMRFQVIGGELKSKVWKSTDAEPADWSVTHSDASPRPNGEIGFFDFNGSSSIPVTRVIDWWGWSLDPVNQSAPILS